MRATITVPATVANLGPGFDIFAVALELANEVRVETLPGEAALSIDPGPGAGPELQDPGLNLVARAFSLACERLGASSAGVRLSCVNRVPFARGLGSSAAAALGGVLAAAVLHGDPKDHSALLDWVTELEGHADNAAAALLGGLAICAPGLAPLTVEVPDDLRAVVLVPEAELRTAESRSVVPTVLPRADAVFNAARCALMVRALSQRDYTSLGAAMEDRWHQDARSVLLPAIPLLIAAAREAGAHGAALAGAGPSVIALCDSDTAAVEEALLSASSRAGLSGSTLVSRLPNRGAQVVREP